MNCSVRSFDSFMFCSRIQAQTAVSQHEWDEKEGTDATHLCSDFKDIFEAQTRRDELVLEQHDDITVMLVYLSALSQLSLLGFRIRLKSGDLLVQVRNVLLDDVGEFLATYGRVDIAAKADARSRNAH